MLQVKILNPKAKRILDDLASLRLISIQKEEPFPLTDAHKKSIEISRRQIKSGQFKENGQVMSGLRSWLSEK
jgi:hypothetical protein